MEEATSGFLWEAAGIEGFIDLSSMRDFFVEPTIRNGLFHVYDSFE